MIYFIQNSATGNVKIGITNTFVNERKSRLNVGNDSKLLVLKVIKTQNSIESIIHNKLLNYRIRGEWFQFNDDVKRFINEFPDTTHQKTLEYIENFQLTDNTTEKPIDHTINYCESQLNFILKKLDTALIKSRNSGFSEGIQFAQKLINESLKEINNS